MVNVICFVSYSRGATKHRVAFCVRSKTNIRCSPKNYSAWCCTVPDRGDSPRIDPIDLFWHCGPARQLIGKSDRVSQSTVHTVPSVNITQLYGEVANYIVYTLQYLSINKILMISRILKHSVGGSSSRSPTCKKLIA